MGEAKNMNDQFDIEYMEEPAWEIIGQGISDYNAEQAGDDQGKNLCFVLRGADQKVVGGVIAATYWDWLYINLMWIQAEYRGKGYGARLLALAEEEGKRRGAKHSYLDTFSFQAPGFYQQYGYEVFGVLENFPAGHQRYFLKKEL